MASATLRKIAGTVFSQYNSSQRKSFGLIGLRRFANKSSSLRSNESAEKSDAPLKYIGSKASDWKAQQTRTGYYNHDQPWYQTYVIIVSLATFMIYFFILREENDIDLKFNQTLYNHIEGLEEVHILQAIEFNRNKGLDIKALENRLREIREQK